ncbi:MAG TPA: NAD-dependent epimerase/dehydratase family protein, partial [Chthoniobacteraceae bacterium]
MKILLTGACGFAGSNIAEALIAAREGLEIIGLDNFIRAGSEINRARLAALGVKLIHGDIRSAADLEALPPADWVIDCAANPSVLAGVDGRTSSRQLLEHNLGGTINLLEYCKAHGAGFILLSTSRVYSIPALAGLKMEVSDGAFRPLAQEVCGFSEEGVDESFSTAAPVSLYGAAKLTSEQLALEYGATFDLPVWINRCGVLAGAGQFGKADQGIFSFWIHSWSAGRPLKYIGFDGLGHQVRDCLHPRDVAAVIIAQLAAENGPRIQHLSGGVSQSMSLRQLSD